ncbi:hypothetical protein ASD76_00975 [Altererythrobacter sp. Root672]|nr:hypothetical protein ASD76_00975 [Altererythrobacter sp. Root672]
MNSEDRYSFNPEIHKLLYSRKRTFGQNWVIVKREPSFVRNETNRGSNSKSASASFFVGRRVGARAN